METNYVLLLGLFLLLVAVDCSSNDPKGNVNEKTGLDQNVDGKVDPVKEKVDSKSILDSIGVSKVKDNGGDQIDASKGGIGSDVSKSNLNQKSGSNEGEILLKDGKESSAEAIVKADGGKEGDNVHNGQEESSVDTKEKTDGEKEGNHVPKGQEESNVGAKGKTDGDKEGNHVQKGQKESNDEAKGKTDGQKEGNNVQKGQEESNVGAKGKTDGDKEGDNVHKGQEESHVEDNGKTDGKKEGNHVQKVKEESNLEAKGKTDGDKEGNNEQKGLEESNVETKGKTDDDKEGDIVHKGQEESNLEVKGQTDGEKKENLDDSVNPKKVIKEKGNMQDSVQSPPPPPQTRNDGFLVEKCDSSNMCMDMNKRFAACLRVPGNESPDLLLLIQNEGTEPLTLQISAPAFLHLEETVVKLKEKQDKKVKIFIRNSGTGNLIVLKDGSGECSLDFKDLIGHNSAKSYVNFLSQTPTTAFIFAAAILILASRWMCKSFRRRQLTRSGLKYQRLDMELPISVRARREPDVNDGWDNSWGDNWDDEEAPVAPSMPVTPSLSSKGLASRRLSKEGWKD